MTKLNTFDLSLVILKIGGWENGPTRIKKNWFSGIESQMTSNHAGDLSLSGV